MECRYEMVADCCVQCWFLAVAAIKLDLSVLSVKEKLLNTHRYAHIVVTPFRRGTRQLKIHMGWEEAIREKLNKANSTD
jgi:hypothetical protein